MSMLPEFKCNIGTAFAGFRDAALELNLTTASNCESIRPIFRQVSGFTVAQQPVNFTRFLFNPVYETGTCKQSLK